MQFLYYVLCLSHPDRKHKLKRKRSYEFSEFQLWLVFPQAEPCVHMKTRGSLPSSLPCKLACPLEGTCPECIHSFLISSPWDEQNWAGIPQSSSSARAGASESSGGHWEAAHKRIWGVFCRECVKKLKKSALAFIHLNMQQHFEGFWAGLCNISYINKWKSVLSDGHWRAQETQKDVSKVQEQRMWVKDQE